MKLRYIAAFRQIEDDSFGSARSLIERTESRPDSRSLDPYNRICQTVEAGSAAEDVDSDGVGFNPLSTTCQLFFHYKTQKAAVALRHMKPPIVKQPLERFSDFIFVKVVADFVDARTLKRCIITSEEMFYFPRSLGRIHNLPPLRT